MYNQLFKILSAGLHSDIQDITLKDIDWDKLAELAVRHSVAAHVFHGIKRIKEGAVPNSSIEIKSVDLGMFYLLAEKQERKFLSMWDATEKLSEQYAQEGIRTIVIKGYGIASLYPHPKSRYSCDLDCFLVDAKDSSLLSKDLDSNEKAWSLGNDIASRNQCKVNTDIYLHSTFEYKGLHVENHRYLTPVKGSRRMKAFERLLRSILCEEGTTTLGNTNVEVPSLLFTALYSTYHAQKHLLRFEITLKMVCDWAVIVKHAEAAADFDWQRFWSICEQYGMGRFARAMTGLAHDVCNVDIPDIKRDPKAERLLLDYIISPYEGYHRTDNIWENRFNLVREMFKARKRYAEFTDMRFLDAVIATVKGRFVED